MPDTHVRLPRPRPWGARRLLPRHTLAALALALALLGFVGAARVRAEQPAQQPPQKLRVATKPLPPFVMKDGDKWAGFSIELWDKLAQEINEPYEWVEVATVTDQINAVRSGGADAAIAGISMTREREAIIDFSHPYFNAGLQIMTPAKGSGGIGSYFNNLKQFFTSPALLQILMFGILFAIVMAHVIWLLERDGPNNFPRGYVRGVWEGAWWVLNIVANGEYGEKTTPHFLKRVMTIMFWLIGVALIAQFTATVTSSLTVQQLQGNISGPTDLPGKSIATVKGSTAAQWLTSQSIDFTPVDKIEDAYALLENDKAQAVVYDAPVLLYYANNKGKGSVQTVGPIFRQETYGIALPTGSPLRKELNEALLKLRQDGTYDDLYNKWFGNTN
ncbi:MAG: transporter substrate-binding domain-containing protein [Anaerolineae bacterium]